MENVKRGTNGQRFIAPCLLAGGLLLLPACSVRKRQEKTAHRRMEVLQLHTDSLSASRRLLVESERVSHWEVIRLSPPDSVGRQHVSTILRSRSTHSRHSSSQDSLKRYAGKDIGVKTEERSDETIKKQRGLTTACKWLIGVVAAIGVITLLRLRKRG